MTVKAPVRSPLTPVVRSPLLRVNSTIAAPVTSGAIVGDRSKFPTSSGTVGVLGASQIAHTAPAAGAISALVFTDVWWFLNPAFSVTLIVPDNTIKKWVEYPQGTFTPVTWAAASSVTMNTTTRQVTSDPCPVSIPAGASWWEHTLNAGASASMALRENSANASVLGVLDSKYTAADVNTPAHQASGEASAVGFGSALITGTVASAGYKSVYCFGDSILWGQGDITGIGVNSSSGYVARKLAAMGLGYAMYAKPGISMSNFTTQMNAGSPTIDPFMVLVRAAATHILVEGGVNDLRLGRTEAQLLADWQNLYGKFTGKGIVQATLTPRSTSTDSWATTVNQTPQIDGNWAALATLNADIRAGMANVTFVMESADAAMSARDSGIWTLAYGVPTADGTHPTSPTAAGMAAAIPLTIA